MRDRLPKRARTNESCIVNLEQQADTGSHWVAFKKRNRCVYYFDSFGDLKPPAEIQEYLQNCTIYYNYNTYQSFDSVVCGHLCLQFLLAQQL